MARFSTVMDEEAVARFLKVPLSRFRDIRASLEANDDFPKPHPVLGRWFRAELEAWADQMAYRDTAWGRLMESIERRGE